VSVARVDPRIARSRAAVLGAVVEILIERGLPAVTIDAVVTRSGVARATVYRHWPTRRELILDALNRLVPDPPSSPATGGTVEERLAQLLLTFAMQLTEQAWVKVLPTVLAAAQHDPDLSAFMPGFIEQRRNPLRDVLRDAVAAGELDPDVEPGLAMAQLAGPIFYRLLFSGEPCDADLCRRLARDFVAAHRSGRPAPKQ
jgi:TetR/AcrR family transcriptional regulator of autoinduction and epiphytic fitness